MTNRDLLARHSIRTIRGLCLLSAIFALGACATDQQRTRAEGAAAGAGIGAIIGAVTGDSDDAARGALIGGVLGLAAGDAVARQKAEYAKREDALRVSAERAQQLAAETRYQNELLSGEIATLEKDVARLQAAKVSASMRNTRMAANQARAATLLKGVDDRLVALKSEISQQQALLETEQRLAKESGDRSLEPRMQLVAAGLRDLQANERALERAKAQLQLIDSKRAY